ncbi:MAG TPA: hypothetical protein VFE53_16855 [Mucilaginibacter sp.]|jgi:hypothetical protein|nr:hypothetical protein [Mucilaginibacter sp.]
MENYPFDTTGLGSDTIDLFNDTYKALQSKLEVQLTGNIDFSLTQFEVFKEYEGVNLRGSFAIKQQNGNDCYALLVEAHWSEMGRYERYNKCEYQTWVVAYLKNDFDRVLIRRETLADKIIELVHPVELDFDDDKAFSDTFYVLVNDRNKAIRSIDRNFRNAVMDLRHDDLVIEIVGHTLIAGSPYPIMPGTAVQLAEFAERLCKLC